MVDFRQKDENASTCVAVCLLIMWGIDARKSFATIQAAVVPLTVAVPLASDMETPLRAAPLWFLVANQATIPRRVRNAK